MIEVRDLVKQYGKHTAVDHLSFTIEKGKIYGFLGPNGAGKSTTMNMITGYIGPTSGTILVNGHDTVEEPELAKKCIGFLPELPPVYLDMTVKEYLNFASELKGIAKKDRDAHVWEVAKMAHLEDVFERLIGNLSKGYRQRVGVAQALIGLPDVIILDEPTVGLDPKQVIEIRELIKKLGKDHTVIFSSHILSEVQEICDQIIIINQGKLVADGTPEELEREFGASSMQLTVKSAKSDAIKSRIESVFGVSSVTVEASSDKESSFFIKLLRGADVREQIFNICVEESAPILSMRSSEFSLENIFLQVTRERARARRRKKAAAAGVSAKTDVSEETETKEETEE